MIVILAGSSKDIKFYHMLMAIYSAPFHPLITQVYSGLAEGADSFGKQWARNKNIPVRGFKAEWRNFDLPLVAERFDKTGKLYNAAAGIVRNHAMVDEGAQALIAAWDGKSLGTKDTIDYAREKKILVHVLRYTCPKCAEPLSAMKKCYTCLIHYDVKDLLLR